MKTEGEVLLALRDYFAVPQYAVLPGVRNGAGFSATRTADALVMSVWPSRGLHLMGIEIKVSRSDWLRELKNPKKADDIAKYCDFWYVAVGDESIVKDGELPPTWGLIVPGKKPGTVRMKAVAQKLETTPISRSFLASILRNAMQTVVPLANVDAEIERRVKEQVQIETDRLKAKLTSEFDPTGLKRRNETLEAAHNKFFDATGINVMVYDPSTLERYKEALSLVRYRGVSQWLEEAEKEMKNCAERMNQLRKAIPGSDQHGI